MLTILYICDNRQTKIDLEPLTEEIEKLNQEIENLKHEHDKFRAQVTIIFYINSNKIAKIL